MRRAAAMLAMLAAPAASVAVPLVATAEEALAPYVVEGDAIPRPLGGRPGDAARGAALAADRHRSLCVLCHALPAGERHLQGNLAPDLKGVGGRLSEGQIRLRIVDMKALAPASIMPSYYRLGGGERVAAAWRGRPMLGAREIEDLVAFLATLKE